MLTTGHEKSRVTVLLSGRSDGYKFIPYVLIPKKRPIKKLVDAFRGKLELVWCGKSWMNDFLTADFLKRIIGHDIFGKRLLVWDSFRCHISESTKKVLRQMKIDTAVIPGGLTKFVQVR